MIAQKHSIVVMPPDLFFWREHTEQQMVLEKKDFEIEAIRYKLNNHFLSSRIVPCRKKKQI